MKAKKTIIFTFLISLLGLGVTIILFETTGKRTIDTQVIAGEKQPSKFLLKSADIYTKIREDFIKLRLNSDKRLFSPKRINWQIRDPDIRKEKLQQALNLQLDPSSQIGLEVEVFSQVDQSETLTILQLNFEDVSTQNKILEFSRMYEHDKKKPD